MTEPHMVVSDPFELPEWLAAVDVVWRADTTVVGGAHVAGTLAGSAADQRLGLDLLAVDAAVPAPVCPEHHRTDAHHAWHRGESLLVEVGARVTLAVPGHRFDVDMVCEALRRFTRAVGASASRYSAQIRL
ncbi:MAG TPA: hypothetical protein VFJ14_08725 [Nocardioidaceae bacterium]|nr:hypothetical protein [Nocardioidaceae bacterium]